MAATSAGAGVCTIATAFARLSAIKNDPECLAGCSGGACPADWYPRAADACNEACAATFVPFCAFPHPSLAFFLLAT